jgi:hypothetical protein
MTLNMTVLTPLVIYQSADFRLTNPKTRKPLRDPSPKTVTLTYFDWSGFITYTGVGKWSDRDISDYIAEWLTGVTSPSMTETADIIQNKGSALLRAIEKGSRQRYPHTFTLAGFEGQGPKVYVISNFEDCYGDARSSVDDHLTTTTRSLGYAEKAIVIVTGYKPAVLREERRLLARVATKYPGDALRIRRRMASINAAAAPRSRNKVSAECVVLSFRSDGTGASLLGGQSVDAPGQFPHIMNGINMNKVLIDAMKGQGLDLSKMRVESLGFGSSRPGRKIDEPKIPCRYAVIDPDPSADYKVTEIKTTEFEPISARDICDNGTIVGTGRAGLRTDQPQNMPWSYIDGKVSRLNYWGLATAVNDKGHVAAVLQAPGVQPPSWQRAAVYADASLIELPLFHGPDERPARSDSEVGAINSSSFLAGSVAVQLDESQPLIKHAAVFRAGQPILVFNGLQPKDGCRAFGVNEQGHVLLIAGVGNFDVRSVLWDPSEDSWNYVGDDSAKVHPIAVNDDDVVLGQARNNLGQPVAVVCHPGRGWERVGTPDNWVPVDINNKGEIIGRVWIDQLERPSLHRPDGRTIMLPYLTDHHTTCSSINNLGQIAGGAAKDRDFHALLWSVS